MQQHVNFRADNVGQWRDCAFRHSRVSGCVLNSATCHTCKTSELVKKEEYYGYYFERGSSLGISIYFNPILVKNSQHLLILHKQTIFVLSFASVIDSMAAF
jgi:hypothetical protein